MGASDQDDVPNLLQDELLCDSGFHIFGRFLTVDSNLLITNGNGSSGTLYRAVKSTEAEYELRATPLATIPEGSSLSCSVDEIARLRSADIFVIVSSLSGAGLAAIAYDNILAPLLNILSIDATVHKTSSGTSHREFIETALFSANTENVIVVFGGDTMVYDILNALAKNHSLSAGLRSFTLSLVPCGTGNALATSLGITSIPIGISRFFGISTVSRVEQKTLPVVKVTIQEEGAEKVIWSAVVCSWGLHASLVADSDTPEMRRLYGPKRFNVLLLMIVFIIDCSREIIKSFATCLSWRRPDK